MQVRYGLGKAAREDLRQPEAARRHSRRHATHPWPDALPKWDLLTFLQKKLYACQAEVFAAYAAYTDYEIGRVIQAVEDMGNNTLIIYICGDNGTSAEGTLSGTFNQMTVYNGILDVPEPLELLHFEDWGSDKTYPHMAVGWAWAFEVWPFRGPATSKTWAASAPSSITSSTSFRRSLKSRASG
jgi:arylsulfatase A-like enzyme